MPMAGAKPETDAMRRLPNYVPSPWDYIDFTSFISNDSAFESYNIEIEALKVDIKDMLLASTDDPVEKIIFIDSICRLGVSYHFENEIEEQLKHFYSTQTIAFDDPHYDLYQVSVLFRTFRQHGFKLSCDLFNKFKDADGNFKESLKSDVRALLSLYEASYLSVHGEDILDEALEFTRTHLKSLVNQSSPHVAKQVTDALILPYHKGIPRIETRKFISAYEKDEPRNELLLKFAKLDFNRLQLLHQQELTDISRWYKKNFDMRSDFPYARDRIVESYLWGLGALFEPHYALARMIVGKSLQFITILDDTYDEYGTIEELQCFTNAAERWDVAAVDKLPDYMKTLYKILLKFCDDFINELEVEQRSDALSEIKNKFKELFRAYTIGSRWSNDGYMPTYDEYMKNSTISNAQRVVLLVCFLGMGEPANGEAIEWLKSSPKFVLAVEKISRLINDMNGSEQEENREHVISAAKCYVKEYGVPKEKALRELQREVANAWKDINEECMRPTALPLKLLMPVLNIERVSEETYKLDNGYTNPLSLKDAIASLVVDKIPLEDVH